MSKKKLIVGTRSSQLALWQANYVAEALRRHDPELTVQLQHIAVPKLSVNITSVHMRIHLVHHNRYAEIVPDSGGTSHMVVMMMS